MSLWARFQIWQYDKSSLHIILSFRYILVIYVWAIFLKWSMFSSKLLKPDLEICLYVEYMLCKKGNWDKPFLFWNGLITVKPRWLGHDDLFTLDDSNSFFSPYEILPIAQENKYLGNFFYLSKKLYAACIHKNGLIEAILMTTLNISLLYRRSKILP